MTLSQKYLQGTVAVHNYRVDENTRIPTEGGRDRSTDLLLGAMKPSRATAFALSLQEPLQKALNDLRRQGANGITVHKQLEVGLRAAAAKVGAAAREEVSAARAQVERVRKRWEDERYGNPTKSLLRFEEARARIASMTSEELVDAGNEYIRKPAGRVPVEVDLLRAALREADPDLSDVVRKIATENLYELPWLTDPEAEPWVRAVAKYAGLKPGCVVAEDSEGRTAVFQISDLLDLDAPLEEPPLKTFD